MSKLRATRAIAVVLLTGWAYASLGAQEKLDPAALAARIDQRLEEKWQGVEAAPPADDAEFLRRVYLDLAGRIPRVQEVRDFLEDSSSDRRSRVVAQLLKSPQFVRHFSTTWWNLLIPSTNPQFAALADGFRPWLGEQLRNDTPYDKMVRDILSAPLAAQFDPDSGTPVEGPSPVGFLLANEQKPENVAASASRIFMGVKLECAQCHDHPFARWSKAQFWEMAAFFRDVEPRPAPAAGAEQGAEKTSPLPPRAIRIPGTDTIVQAKFLTGDEPEWVKGTEPRSVLANWLTAKDNPYFARAAVNRLWAHFFGVGLIDPVDDEPTDENPVRHPELLADLSQQFVAHDYDIKYLIRAFTATKAYQRTSSQSHASQADLRAFARMAVRGMTSEQVFDSIALATGFRENQNSSSGGPDALGNPTTTRGDFLNRFAGQERATERQTSILQALALMNGRFVADATSLDRSSTLAAVADAPFMTFEQKIETLYLATLSRLPRPEETQRLGAYVSAGGPRGEARAALGDVLWALLNSSEFILNH
jgi:hypothetical protein